jgi:hypothetical protein
MWSPLAVLAILGVIQHAVSAPDSKYTTRYDNIDIDGILKSERLLKNYFNCLMDEGPCTQEGLELKSELRIFYPKLIYLTTFFQMLRLYKCINIIVQIFAQPVQCTFDIF